MKSIIHLSDLHVGYKDFNKRLLSVVDHFISQLGDHAQDYILVITGDLVDNAHHLESFHIVKSRLNDLKQAGFKHILIIPGNHDFGTGDHGDKKFVKIFSEIFYPDRQDFPRKDIIDGLALIGLNSMAEELNWYDSLFAQGEIGKQQLQVLEKMLKEPDVRTCRKRVVYLHHHPFDYRPLHQLKDARKLKRVLKNAMKEGITIDALLFGHNHEGNACNGKWGIPRCYDAGSITFKPRPSYVNWLPWFQVKSSVRVIDIESPDTAKDYSLKFPNTQDENK